MEHLFSVHSFKVVVIWGPTGCGKTMCIRSSMKAAGFELNELSGVDTEDTCDLLKRIQATRKVHSFSGRVAIERTERVNGEYRVQEFEQNITKTAVFLDDFESFTPDARKAVVECLKKTEKRGHAPTLITCTQIKHIDMQCLADFCQIRMFAPRIETIRTFLCRTLPHEHVNRAIASHEGSRDLRRIKRHVEWMGVGNKPVGKQNVYNDFKINNNFEASRRLLKGECTLDEWMKATEPRDLTLLQHHIPDYVDTTNSTTNSTTTQVVCERLANSLDYLSISDSLLPSRFESSELMTQYRLYVGAGGVKLNSRAQGVGALPPPRRLVEHKDARPPRHGDPTLQVSQEAWLDMPRSLRDQWTRPNRAPSQQGTRQ
jgi:hypothetical protein